MRLLQIQKLFFQKLPKLKCVTIWANLWLLHVILGFYNEISVFPLSLKSGIAIFGHLKRRYEFLKLCFQIWNFLDKLDVLGNKTLLKQFQASKNYEFQLHAFWICLRKKKQIISSTKEYLMNFLSDKGPTWSMLDNFVTLVKGQYSNLILSCVDFKKYCTQCYACSQCLCKFS